MILVTCTTCGVVFDIFWANSCERSDHAEALKVFQISGVIDETTDAPGTTCKLCPLGHAGHDTGMWWNAKRRPATDLEKKAGFDFMLPDFDVPGGFKP